VYDPLIPDAECLKLVDEVLGALALGEFETKVDGGKSEFLGFVRGGGFELLGTRSHYIFCAYILECVLSTFSDSPHRLSPSS
jgi:hypothetical protein